MTGLRVSVLMPVLDGARTIRTALDSVLRQTCTDLEVIVVDDGSQDDTVRIVTALDDGRIRMLRNPGNLGIPASLRRATAAARAPFLARLDADDRWVPEYLARQLAVLGDDRSAAMVTCWTRDVDGDGDAVGASRPSPEPGFASWELTHRNALYPSATVLRSAALRAVGGFRDPFAVAEDHDLWTRLVMAGERLVVLADTLVDYRRASAGITATTPTDTSRRLGLAVRRGYLEWLLGRAVPPATVGGFWDLMSWRPLPEDLRGGRLREATAFAAEVARQVAQRCRLPAATRRAIDRRAAATWLHHAAQIASCAPRDAAHLARAAARRDPRLLRRRALWPLLLDRGPIARVSH